MARTQKIRNSTRPTIAFLLDSTARSRPPPRRRTASGCAVAAVEVSTRSAVIGRYAFARARGSSQAIAKSQMSSATSTATVNSMNSACMSG